MSLGSDPKYMQKVLFELNREKAAAESILEQANFESRELTDDEKREYTAHIDAGLKWKASAEAEKKNLEFRKQLAELGENDPILSDAGGAGEEAQANPRMSIGELFVKSGIFKALKAAKIDGRLPEGFKTQGVRVPYNFKSPDIPVLEANATGLFGDGSTAGPVSTLIPGVFTPGQVQLRPTIADLLPVIPISVGNTAVWRVASREVPGSGDEPVAEGEPKPPVKYEFTPEAKQLEKYAAHTKISEEYIEDDAAVAAFINADLPLQIRIIEEYKLALALYDSVSDAASLSTGTTLFDNVLAAMVQIQAAGGNPNGLIVTPTNWAEMLASKFGTGAGDLGYVGGGPFAPTSNPWGLRVVVSAAAVDDHPLVGDFTMGAKLFRKGQLTMASTNSNEDDFLNNLVAIRAEIREILGKQYPEFFVSVDLT